jgi:L-ascorbate metabolism protein UlaG (beta-lactamase superfamily)
VEQDEPGREHRSRIWFLGHATVLIHLDGTTLLTDPLLRGRASALLRRHPVPDPGLTRRVDAVLLSHLHHDHLDVPSLRQLGSAVRLLGPRHAGAFLARRGFLGVRELAAGDAVAVNTVRVVATPARHNGFRAPFGPVGGCLGFLVEGSARIYFAGDTALFPEMEALGPVDVALLPVGGWGPGLGAGHMDALQAARALRLIRPKIAVPIHWGTFAPLGMHVRHWSYLARPPIEFLAFARDLAPDVEVRVLTPGSFFDLDAPPGPAPLEGPAKDDASRRGDAPGAREGS